MTRSSPENDSLSEQERILFEAELDRIAETSSVKVVGKRFLGLFEPHDALSGLNLMRGARGKQGKGQAVVEKQMDVFIGKGFQVAVCFEHGQKRERGYFKAVDELLRTGKETGDLNWESLLISYLDHAYLFDENNEIVDVIDEDAAHSLSLLIAFLGWQTKGNRKDKIWGFLEKMPKSVPRLGRSFDIAKSQKHKKMERINRLTQIIAHAASRDLAVSGQIIDEMESSKDPLAVVAIRGTAHVGLAPGLNVLGEGIYNNDFFGDIEEPRRITTSNIDYTFLPILWSRRFWEEMVSENGIDYKATRWDTTYSKVYRWTRGKLYQKPWKQYLFDKISEFDKTRGEKVAVELNQNAFG